MKFLLKQSRLLLVASKKMAYGSAFVTPINATLRQFSSELQVARVVTENQALDLSFLHSDTIAKGVLKVHAKRRSLLLFG